MAKATYKDAGVDLDVYRESMARIGRLVDRAKTDRVMPLPGGFAGLFNLIGRGGEKYKDPILVSCTDGVGTKLKVAALAGIHDTVGIDLVAMSINDAVCCGAEPLFFLDYVAMPKDDPPLLEQIVEGIVSGCEQSDCALLGGETAILPDVYGAEDYDLAGFCVAVVERDELIDGSTIAADDVVIGVASAGLHSNGYSLVRKIVFEIAGLSVDAQVEELGTTVGRALLTPTRLYARPVVGLLSNLKENGAGGTVHGIAHITGGGLEENIERLLSPGVHVKLKKDSWEIPPIFPWLQKLGEVDTDEMYRVFNMGLGLALIVSRESADKVRKFLDQADLPNWEIGRVIEGDKGVSWEC